MHTFVGGGAGEREGGRQASISEVRKNLSNTGEVEMAIFKIENTTPFLSEQNINDPSFGSHHGCGREKIAFWVAEVWEDMRQDNSQ